MATIELTKESFSDIVGGAKLVLVDFWGPHCRLCRMFEPVFEQASQRHPNAVFGTVDAQTHGQLAAMFRVMSLPTLVIVKDGYVIYARSGTLALEDLEDLVGQADALDMDQVRRKRAARRRTASSRPPPDLARTKHPTHRVALSDRPRSSTAQISSVAGNRPRNSSGPPPHEAGDR